MYTLTTTGISFSGENIAHQGNKAQLGTLILYGSTKKTSETIPVL